MKMKLPECAERLIKAAKGSTTKGNYTVYNSYRQELNTMALSPADHQEAVKRLADALRV